MNWNTDREKIDDGICFADTFSAFVMIIFIWFPMIFFRWDKFKNIKRIFLLKNSFERQFVVAANQQKINVATKCIPIK